MQTKYKRHQKVRLLRAPLVDDIEPYTDPPMDIKAGMEGEVNIILPNGQYHVAVKDSDGEVIAYVALEEEALQPLESGDGLEDAKSDGA